MSNTLPAARNDERSYVFRAKDLADKFGFGDGDLLDDTLMDRLDGLEAPDDDHMEPDHEVLARCVLRYLAPLMDPPLPLMRIHSQHNPIRLDEMSDARFIDENLSVEIPEHIVLAIADEVEAEYRALIEAGRTPRLE